MLDLDFSPSLYLLYEGKGPEPYPFIYTPSAAFVQKHHEALTSVMSKSEEPHRAAIHYFLNNDKEMQGALKEEMPDYLEHAAANAKQGVAPLHVTLRLSHPSIPTNHPLKNKAFTTEINPNQTHLDYLRGNGDHTPLFSHLLAKPSTQLVTRVQNREDKIGTAANAHADIILTGRRPTQRTPKGQEYTPSIDGDIENDDPDADLSDIQKQFKSETPIKHSIGSGKDDDDERGKNDSNDTLSVRAQGREEYLKSVKERQTNWANKGLGSGRTARQLDAFLRDNRDLEDTPSFQAVKARIPHAQIRDAAVLGIHAHYIAARAHEDPAFEEALHASLSKKLEMAEKFPKAKKEIFGHIERTYGSRPDDAEDAHDIIKEYMAGYDPKKHMSSSELRQFRGSLLSGNHTSTAEFGRVYHPLGGFSHPPEHILGIMSDFAKPWSDKGTVRPTKTGIHARRGDAGHKLATDLFAGAKTDYHDAEVSGNSEDMDKARLKRLGAHATAIGYRGGLSKDEIDAKLSELLPSTKVSSRVAKKEKAANSAEAESDTITPEALTDINGKETASTGPSTDANMIQRQLAQATTLRDRIQALVTKRNQKGKP